MKNQELLRQAFDEGKWPKAITYCFQNECPKKDDCLHFLYGQCKPTEAKSGLSVFQMPSTTASVTTMCGCAWPEWLGALTAFLRK